MRTPLTTTKDKRDYVNNLLRMAQLKKCAHLTPTRLLFLEGVAYFGVGIWAAFGINIMLSYETFSVSIKIIALIGIGSIVPALAYNESRGKVSHFETWRLIVLGGSVASIISAIVAFLEYTYFTPFGPGTVVISRESVTSIFRSIVLASIFSFVERSIRFLEDRRRTS